jgi:UDP-N-acetylglucosamine acyltransferase
VLLGKGNWIGPYAVILGEVEIGDDNWIGPHAVIGTPPEHRSFHEGVKLQPLSGKIVIGSRNVIHEHVAIQAPIGSITSVNDECFIMHGAHVAHDVRLAKGVTISPGAVLGGHSTVGYRATLGIGVAVHQYSYIGPLSMVGMNATVVKNVEPFSMVVGSPARFLKVNLIGLEREKLPLGSWTEFINKPLAHWIMPEVPDEVLEILNGWSSGVH